MAKNSIVMICKNIKLDKDYQNCLTYTETEMYNLCYANKVAIATDFSFVKESDSSILVQFSYEDCMKCNYLAFQNPRYSNKWFFAFIDSVEYISDKTSRINFSIDFFSTWFDYWTAVNCFVEREHVNDDTVGLHTIPEGLETGEYICNDSEYYTGFDELMYMIQASEDYAGLNSSATDYGGVYLAGNTYFAPDKNTFIDVLNAFSNAGKSEAVYNSFLVPKKFVGNIPTTPVSQRWSGQNAPISDYQVVNVPTTLDNYSPVNNKLKTFPYMYLYVSNNNGTSNIYHYERFHPQEYAGHVDFEIKGVPVVGGSIKLIPLDYDTRFSEECGMMAGKFPALNWSEDTYTNWLTQNSVNLAVGVISSGLQIVGGLGLAGTGAGSVAGAGAVASGITSIVGQLGQMHQHELLQHTARGNTNGGDINVTSQCNGFYFYKMSIKEEYARVIDNFFTRFGYKVNSLKLPNQTGRTYFNYVKIGSSEIIGYPNTKGCPSDAMETINRIYRNGVTLWHSHDRIGNYTGNTIINPPTPTSTPSPTTTPSTTP